MHSSERNELASMLNHIAHAETNPSVRDGWNAHHYLQFANERTRPAIDLVTRISMTAPRRIVDLGCGPGNSTQVLRQRWPGARITGVDNSQAMLAEARARDPEGDWEQGDIAHWHCKTPVCILFANASLQWVPDHARLIPRLMSKVALGGILAFQIPSDQFSVVRNLIHEIAQDHRWVDRMQGPLQALTMESPRFYYEALALHACSIDLWETEYSHVMTGSHAIVEWISSTGLRPFLEALSHPRDQDAFVAQLRERVAEVYKPCVDGKVLFPFRRLFVVAQR